MKITPKLAQALLNLRANTDFGVFLHSVGDYGEDVVQKVMYDKDNRDEHAGSAIAITQILKVASTASDKLNQIKDKS